MQPTSSRTARKRYQTQTNWRIENQNVQISLSRGIDFYAANNENQELKDYIHREFDKLVIKNRLRT